MYTLLVKGREDIIIEFTVREEARQELMRHLDDGRVTNYQYQMYLGFLLNGYDQVMIDGEAVFEVGALVEA